MRKALLIVAVLLLATPVMAATTITAVKEGVVWTAPDGNKVQTVRIDYSSDVDIRAFALDINIDSDGNSPNFQGIRGFKTGESNAASPGYGIFPSRFRDFIVVTGPVWTDPNYNPTPAWNEPETVSPRTGLGFPKMIVEMGTLYAGDANKPALSGTLFRFDVNAWGKDGTFNLSIAANALRGGVVNADGNTIVANFVGAEIVFAPSNHTISGSTGLAGVTMSGLPNAPVTDGSGNYSDTVPDGWSGTVTPTRACYSFSPASRTYSNVTSDQTAQNYTATALTYTISGQVVGSVAPKNTGISGLVMSGLPGNPITNGTGNYTATVPCGWSGTVTPTDANSQWSFAPANKVYSNVASNQTAQNYTGTALECLNARDAAYATWKSSSWNKPNCWCFKKQCRGDINGTASLGKPITTADLGIFKSAYNIADTALKTVPNGICADLNHTASLGKRVTTADLGIFKSNYNKADASVPICPSTFINAWKN